MVKELKWEDDEEFDSIFSVCPTEYSPFCYHVYKNNLKWYLEVDCLLYSVPLDNPNPVTTQHLTKPMAVFEANRHFKNFIKSCLLEE